MKTTGNLGLKKPDGTDIVDITDLNGNMDILDTAVKAVQDHAADAVKHITAAERTAWNAKASTAAATASAAGLMAAADKAKLDGVAAGANNYVHPNHTGDVTSTGDGVTAIAPGVIVNADVNAAAAIDATKIGTGVVSNAEFGYLDGVTSGIQGQLNGKSNLTTTPQQTTADITYYVRTDGNDGNTGLGNTAGGAFKTVQKAISMIPQVIRNSVNIYISDGTYPEDVTVKGFNFGAGGGLTIMGNSSNSAAVKINSLEQHSNFGLVTIEGITATSPTKDAFIINRCVGFRLNNCQTVVSAPSYSGVLIYFSTGIINGGTYSNHIVGVNINASSQVQVIGTAGTGNAVGIGSNDGAILSKFNITITGNQTEGVAGGTITSGVLNPWGDNTTNLRPTVWAYRDNSAQIIEANVFRAMIFNVKSTDNSYSYNNTTGYFTANQTGWYQFKIRAICTSIPTGIAVFIRIVHGDAYRDIAYAHGFSTDLEVGGDIQLYMGAGDTLVPQLVSGVATTIMPGAQYSRFESIRLS